MSSWPRSRVAFCDDDARQEVACLCFFFLMIRRPPRSTLDRSSAASDVYKRQVPQERHPQQGVDAQRVDVGAEDGQDRRQHGDRQAVSYTHLRAHETVLDLVCRLLLEKKNHTSLKNLTYLPSRALKLPPVGHTG